MLSAVVIDRSSDPSADTIAVSTSGSNTLVAVNDTNVYTGASSSITSLSIIGSNYNDTISFSDGNPVPNGTISVDGGGGNNTIAASGPVSQEATLSASSLTLATTPAAVVQTANISNAALSGSVTIKGWVGTATVNDTSVSGAGINLYALPDSSTNAFTAHPTTATLSGTGFTYTSNTSVNGDAAVWAYGNSGSGDSASLDDSGSPGQATIRSTVAQFANTGNYTEDAAGFTHVTVTSKNSGDYGK